MKRLIFDITEIFNQIVLVECGKLIEYHLEKKEDKSILGNIYKGRVQNVLKGMQSAFVDIGIGKNAFLFVNDALYGEDIIQKGLSVTKILKPGQEIMVQVSKEAMGTKNPKVTTNISLPGRYVVIMPNVDYIGISHRIEDEKERNRLLELVQQVKPNNIGVIIRTAAVGVSKEELYRDIENLAKIYGEIIKLYNTVSAPNLIYEESNFIIKYIRDMLSDDIDEIIVNDKTEYENIVKYLRNLGIQKTDKVKFESGDLISMYGVDHQVNKILERKIWLKSGGFIMFDQTEALTVIDVNTGKYVGRSSLEETIFKTNMEAAEEIALQLRLRDIGGIIVIDFIDMNNENNKKKLLEFFKDKLQSDRTKCTVLGYTQLGLVEMTRKRVRSQVSFYLENKCPVCNGKGFVYSNEMLLLKIRREIERIYRHVNTDKLYINSNLRIIKLVKDRGFVKHYKGKFGIDIEFIVDENKKYDEFEISFK